MSPIGIPLVLNFNEYLFWGGVELQDPLPGYLEPNGPGEPAYPAPHHHLLSMLSLFLSVLITQKIWGEPRCKNAARCCSLVVINFNESSLLSFLVVIALVLNVND